jgi:predicted NBD/HSP70 family sugar kinase
VRKINLLDYERATRTTSRRINTRIALNLVREHQPLSRADLARRMDLNRGTVTALVRELLEAGSIIEGGPVASARGRKPKMLYVRTRDRLAVGVDLRFSRIFLALSDFAGNQLDLQSFETIFDPAMLIAELASRIEKFVTRYGGGGDIEGIGVVVPGMLDQDTGRILNAPQLGWHNVDFQQLLAEATGLPVFIETSAAACAIGQMWLGGKEAGGSNNFVYVTVSDGIGVAAVVDGQLLRGATNTATEFGHVPLELEGPRCLCGGRGCWEAYTSNLATITRYLEVEITPQKGRDLLRRIDITVPELIDRARAGDEQARSAIEQTGHYLGIGLAIIVNTINPARVVLSGEITGAWDIIEPQIQRMVRERALTTRGGATPIIPELVPYPRLRGAAALVAAPMFAAPRVA